MKSKGKPGQSRRRLRGWRSAAAPLALAACLAPPAGAANFTVTTTADSVDVLIDGTCADVTGECSLRAAIQEANLAGEPCTISLGRRETYTLTIPGTGEDGATTGDLDVSGQITLRGGKSTLDADALDRAFDVLAGGSLDLSRIIVTGGQAPAGEGGGGIRNVGELTVNRATLSNHSAPGAGARGGAILNDGGTLLVRRTLIESSFAESSGGGIESAGAGSTRVERSALVENTTGSDPGLGGGLSHSGSAQVWITRSNVSDNTSEQDGGGLWNSTGTMVVTRVAVERNRARGNGADFGGGGIFNDGGTLQIIRSRFNDNTTRAGGVNGGSGGGLFNDGGTLEIIRSKFGRNNTRFGGGGIEILDTTGVVMERVRVHDNVTTPNTRSADGGGIRFRGTSSASLSRAVLLLNASTANGAGIWVSSTSSVDIERSRIRLNESSSSPVVNALGGGGLFVDGGTVTISRTKFDSNFARRNPNRTGGGIYNDGGMLTITDSSIRDSVGRFGAGGIEADGGTTNLVRVTLSGNLGRTNNAGTAGGEGGGMRLLDGIANIDDSSITGNTAEAEGGGLWNSSTGMMTVTSSSIRRNDAPVGPDVFNDGGTFTIDGVPVPPGP